MNRQPFRIGRVTFDYPPLYQKKEGLSADAREDALSAELKRRYPDVLFDMYTPLGDGGVRTAEDAENCVTLLKQHDVDCLILEFDHWTRVALAIRLILDLNLPTALVANTTSGRNGITAATAIGASLKETDRGPVVNCTERFMDTRVDEICTWIMGISALKSLHSSRIMSFGGSYGAEIPFTRVDETLLEQMFVSEIMTEQELVIIEGARSILSNAPDRVTGFISWLEKNAGRVVYDEKMLTRESLAFQAAMYLALKDRLKELEGERIKGVTIKCHFEVSTTCIGCTECLIPAFLPFSADAEGEKEVIPVACEGDINGLIGLMLLHSLNPSAPPLFGDLVAYKEDHLLLRNCGSSSVYWAGRSSVPEKTLPKVELLPNMHGKSGAAVHYETPECDEITLARLFRIHGRYYLHYGVGKILPETKETRYDDPWPHTRLKFPSDPYLFFKTAPCNHTSITEGDVTRELEVFCRYTGIQGVRCDSDEALDAFLGMNGET